MLRPGLCSVTFRSYPVEEVVRIAAAAGLAAVEWGGDVHVPPGDPAPAAEVARLGADAGLAVASYGSYLQLATDRDWAPAIETAVALGAPRIRVWAGEHDPAETPAAERAAVVTGARELAARAADTGLVVALEFHGGSLTATAESTLALLAEIGHPAVGTYWQPPVGAPDDEALAGLDLLLDQLVGVHAFSLWSTQEWLPLAARRGLWEGVAARLAARGEPADVLLEFVARDDPAQLVADAATLREILTAAQA